MSETSDEDQLTNGSNTEATQYEGIQGATGSNTIPDNPSTKLEDPIDVTLIKSPTTAQRSRRMDVHGRQRSRGSIAQSQSRRRLYSGREFYEPGGGNASVPGHGNEFQPHRSANDSGSGSGLPNTSGDEAQIVYNRSHADAVGRVDTVYTSSEMVTGSGVTISYRNQSSLTLEDLELSQEVQEELLSAIKRKIKKPD